MASKSYMTWGTADSHEDCYRADSLDLGTICHTFGGITGRLVEHRNRHGEMGRCLVVKRENGTRFRRFLDRDELVALGPEIPTDSVTIYLPQTPCITQREEV